MALDPSIILGYKQPQIMSGDERQANAYKLKALATEDQINQAKLQDYADKQAQAQALKAWQQAHPNPTAKDYLGAGYIDQAKDVAGVETSTLANDAASLKLAHDKANYFASTTGAVMQNPTYENAVGAVKDAAAKGYISSEEAQAELSKIPQDPLGVKAWATNHLVSSLEAQKQLPQLGQVDSGSKVNLTARSPIDGSTTITGTIDKTAAPMQADPNKPFMPDGTPNKPYQDYARSLKPPPAANEPLVQVMGEDGKPKYVPRSQAIGMRPYSNADDAKQVAADTKAQAKADGSSVVDQHIAALRDAYSQLNEGDGVTSINKKWGSNLAAKVGKSGVGQWLGDAVGTNNQTQRDIIAQTRPLLLQAIMKSTGMSAKQMDSNAELKLWLATATDPTKSLQANMQALDNIERVYGSGATGKPKPDGSLSTQPKSAYTEIRTLPDGRKIGKTKDGKLEIVK